MKKLIAFVSCILFGLSLHAQQQIVLDIWPYGAPNSNELTGEEFLKNGTRITNVTKPTLTIFPAKNPNGLAIIACPGGGYAHLAMDTEGTDMADWFNRQGITYAVLKYRMPNGHHEVPLSDALESIRIMRQYAEKCGFKKIGIMGSSAGGHLASTVATHFTEDSRPDFQILFYPVITSDPSYSHQGSIENLCGKNPSQEMLGLYANEKQIKENTPPAFIMHCTDDKVVPVANSINYYMALVEKNISASLHIWPEGGHGWGYRDNFSWKREWTGELEKWLRELEK